MAIWLSPKTSGSRTRILEAARTRFERFGFRRAGISEIAREAGLATGTLYRHFESKEAIFLEVMAAENEEWLACAKQALEAPGSPSQRIGGLIAASVRFNSESALFRAVIDRDTDMVTAPLLDPIAERVREQTVAMMADVIREGVDDGSLRPVDPPKAALVLYLAGQALFNQPQNGYQELAPTFLDIAWNGIQQAPTGDSDE
jgi:AcrR family transcriptional regulator